MNPSTLEEGGSFPSREGSQASIPLARSESWLAPTSFRTGPEELAESEKDLDEAIVGSALSAAHRKQTWDPHGLKLPAQALGKDEPPRGVPQHQGSGSGALWGAWTPKSASSAASGSAVPRYHLTAEELMKELQRIDPRNAKASKRFETFLYWWRHPWSRMVAPIMILSLDMYIYAADPVDLSQIETAMPLMGNLWNLFNPLLRALAWWAHVIKIVLVIGCIFVGSWVAKALRTRLARIGVFSALRSGRAGCFFPFVCIVLSWAMLAWFWNLVLEYVLRWPRPNKGLPYEQATTPYLTQGIQMTVQHFGQLCMSFVFAIDSLTVILVADVILQDHSQYPEWGTVHCRGKKYDLRQFWMEACGGCFRVFVPWGLFLLALWVALDTIWVQAKEFMKATEATSGTNLFRYQQNEFHRAFLSAMVFFFDVCTVVQDWEFPTFENNLRLAFLGTNVVFEGRFINYALMIGVMFIDMKSFVTQLMFQPATFGMFVDPNKSVWVIHEELLLKGPLSYLEGNATFALREKYASTLAKYEGIPCFDVVEGAHNACGDVRLRARYEGVFHPRREEGLPWLPVLVCFSPLIIAVFGVIILRHSIAHSRRDLCRRVVQVRALAEEQFGMHRDASQGRVRESALERARKRQEICAKLHHAVAVTKFLNKLKPEAQLEKADQPVRLRRPARKGSLMLVVCSSGVYEVEATLTATVGDLQRELNEGHFHTGIPPERVRLRKGPQRCLKKQELLGRLLPGPGEPPTIIYVLANLGLKDKGAYTEDDADRTLEGNEVIIQMICEVICRIHYSIAATCRGCCGLFRCCRGTCRSRCADLKASWAEARGILDGSVPHGGGRRRLDTQASAVELMPSGR